MPGGVSATSPQTGCLGTVCKYAATDFLLEHPPTIRHMVSYVTDFGQADGIGYLHTIP